MIRRIINSLVFSIKQFSLVEEMSFYAVSKGRKVGIYPTWYCILINSLQTNNFIKFLSRAECEVQIKGYPGAKFKKFTSKEEADAFIDCYKGPEILPVLPRSSTNLLKTCETFKKPSTFVADKQEYGHSSKVKESTSSSGTYYAVAKGKTVGIFSTW